MDIMTNMLINIANKLPKLPRFSDDAQRRAGGNIVKFMAILLALTFVARGTSGATLARVSLSNPARAEIVQAVTGHATVSAMDVLDIFAPEGLIITEMLAGVGQTVNTGDAVARFDMAEINEKLSREAASLDKMLLEVENLERSAATDNASLDSARRVLDRAIEDHESAIAQAEADIATAKADLDEAIAKLSDDPEASAFENAWRSLRRANEDYNMIKEQGVADVAAAQAALGEAQRTHAESADLASLNAAKRNMARALEDHDIVKTQGENDIASAQAALENARNNESLKYNEWRAAQNDEATALALAAYLAAQVETALADAALVTAMNRADSNLLSSHRKLEDAEAAVNNAEYGYYSSNQQSADSRQVAIDRARETLAAAQKKAESDLFGAARRVEDAEFALAKAEQDYGNSVQQASETRQSGIDKARDSLTATERKAENDLLAAARRLEDAEAGYASASRDHARSLGQSSNSTAQNRASAVALRIDIEKQKDVTQSLRILSENDGTLYSTLSGVVSAAMTRGETTGSSILLSFKDGAKGFEAHMLLDKSDAEKLNVGSECEVTAGSRSMYFTPTVTGTVSAIALPDVDDNVRVTIMLPQGEWKDGQRVDVQAIQDRSTYDMCIPLSALRSDNIGYFLLAIEQRSTVLGIENIVVRLPVSVVASDREMAAIEGPFGRNSQIISGSNKAVVSGDRVRAVS